jgi:molybdopterin-containing oxidoreductase family membrane subunit
MGRVLVLVGIVYFYFNLNEFLVPGYKLKTSDAIHLRELFAGHYAALFWGIQILELVITVVLLLYRQMRRPLPMMIISLFVLCGAWLKRFIIVVPPQAHPNLPIQNMPAELQE